MRPATQPRATRRDPWAPVSDLEVRRALDALPLPASARLSPRERDFCTSMRERDVHRRGWQPTRKQVAWLVAIVSAAEPDEAEDVDVVEDFEASP